MDDLVTALNRIRRLALAVLDGTLIARTPVEPTI